MEKKDRYHLSWDCDCHTSGAEYAERFSGKTGDFMLEKQNEVLREFLGGLRGKRVLDAGGGHGQNAGAVLSAGGEYTALASSPGSDRMLRKKLAELSVEPSDAIEYGGLEKFPFPDRSFDIAVSFRIISHVPDWRLFLGELCRVSGERVIIDFAPAARPFLEKAVFLVKGRFETASRDFTTQSAAEIAAAARESGFYLKALERQFILPMFAHRLADGGAFFGLERAAVKLGLTRFFGGPAVALLKRKEGS